MSQKLSGKQEKAILALLSELTYEAAAKKSGVDPRTLYRWLREPQFYAAWCEARRTNLRRATARLQTAAHFAVNCLLRVMADEMAPHAAKVAAARAVLDSAYRATESDDFSSRLEALEAALAATASHTNSESYEPRSTSLPH